MEISSRVPILFLKPGMSPQWLSELRQQKEEEEEEEEEEEDGKIFLTSQT